MLKTGITTALVTTLALCATVSTLAQNFEIDWHTVDGGGGMVSTGNGFELSGTIGQCDAGTMTGSGFELSGGFWFAIPRGDWNGDGNVTLADFPQFIECMSGPIGAPGFVSPSPECLNAFDFDTPDGDVDLQDFAAFQRAFTGSLP